MERIFDFVGRLYKDVKTRNMMEAWRYYPSKYKPKNITHVSYCREPDGDYIIEIDISKSQWAGALTKRMFGHYQRDIDFLLALEEDSDVVFTRKTDKEFENKIKYYKKTKPIIIGYDDYEFIVDTIEEYFAEQIKGRLK